MRKHLLLVLFVACTTPLMANWNAVVRNYAPQDYQAGAQNWGIAEQKNGWIYIANNYGLLEYDGCHWNLYGLSNSTAVRSVTIGEDGKVYAGGRNQYGYFVPNELGQMVYTSLSDSIPSAYQEFGEVWRIIDNHGDLFVQTRHLLICHIQGKIQVIDPGSTIEAIAFVNGSLYVATQQDVHILAGNRLHVLPGADILRNTMVSQMIDLNGNLLIATDCNGLYLYDGTTIRPYPTDIDALIRKYQIYTLAINNDHLIIGTVQRGILVTSLDGHGCQQLTLDNGLQNNTVLSLCIDQHQRLWVGLDRGISRVPVSQDVMFLQDKTKDYGSGYAYCIHHGTIYLGTNQGLFYQSSAESDLSFIDGSQGQVWALDTIHNTLFCSHNKGLYIVHNRHLQQVLSEGCWHVKPISNDEAIAGTYTGFYYLHYQNGHWHPYRMHGFSETAFHFSIYDHILFVQSQHSIFKLDLDIPNRQLTLLEEDVQDYQVDEPGNIVPANIPLSHSLPWNFLNENHLLIDGFYNSFLTSDSFLIVGGIDGFYRFRQQITATYPQQLYIRQIAITSPIHQIIYGEGYPSHSSNIELSSGLYSMDIRFSGNNASEVTPRFATRLWPLEKEYSDFHESSSRNFTGLQSGHYRLDVMMQDGLTNQSIEKSLNIHIQLPFYQRWWAWCLYGLLIIIIALFIYYRVRRYERDKQERIAREKDIALKQQQLQILELEKAQNKNKLKTKSQELSHMLLTEVSRKEWNQNVLIEVRRIVDLLQKGQYDEARTRTIALQGKLVRNTETTLDWKRFEINFDLVHEQFIAHLKERYPWMSKQERQLCIYIKMGLLTKEIAPLMNISVRGVEMLRYRLRQKMNIPESDNIRKYLDE